MEMKERIIQEETNEIVLRRAHEELPGLRAGLLYLAQTYPIAFMLTVEKAIERADYYLRMEVEIRGAAEKKREEELLKEAIRHNEEELERQAIERKRKKKKRIYLKVVSAPKKKKKKVKDSQKDFGLIKRKKK